MSDQEHWDEEAVYDSEIAPLMAKLITICTAPNLGRTMHRWDADRRGGHVALTETHVTNPDGSKVITIGRVG